MRRFLSPRWLALHALAVSACVACFLLAWWQLTRAQGGNAMSWGYTFEWPVFGLFAIAFWIRLIRDARRRTGTDDVPVTAVRRLRAPVLTGTPRRADRIRQAEDRVPVDVAEEEDEELAAYNRYLAWQNANPHLRRRDYPG